MWTMWTIWTMWTCRCLDHVDTLYVDHKRLLQLTTAEMAGGFQGATTVSSPIVLYVTIRINFINFIKPSIQNASYPSIRLLVPLQLQEKPPFSLFQLHVLSVHILYLFAGTLCLLFHHNIFILNGSFYFTSRRCGSQPSYLSEVPFLLLPLINCRHKSFGYCY